jgi:chorismate mutase
MDLNQLRSKIASLDEAIVKLLNERANYSLEVGAKKRALAT